MLEWHIRTVEVPQDTRSQVRVLRARHNHPPNKTEHHESFDEFRRDLRNSSKLSWCSVLFEGGCGELATHALGFAFLVEMPRVALVRGEGRGWQEGQQEASSIPSCTRSARSSRSSSTIHAPARLDTIHAHGQLQCQLGVGRCLFGADGRATSYRGPFVLVCAAVRKLQVERERERELQVASCKSQVAC